MSLVIGAATIGYILALLALGVYISFRIFEFPDLTAEGSITLGAAVAAVLLTHGWQPVAATAMGALAGGVAGAFTGVLAMKFHVNRLLAGILTMSALYSVNLRIMGKSNVPLLHDRSLVTQAESIGQRLFGTADLHLMGWDVSPRDAAVMLLTPIAVALMAALLYWFLRTNIGTAMRATGDNAQMIRAMGADDRLMVILGLALANAMICLSGALLAQYQGKSASLGGRLIMMHRGQIIHDIRGEEKKRVRATELLVRFEELRRSELLDEGAAAMLEAAYV